MTPDLNSITANTDVATLKDASSKALIFKMIAYYARFRSMFKIGISFLNIHLENPS